MGDIFALLTRGAVITGGLVALYLIITNPKGGQTLLDSGGKAYVSGVRALQGR